MGDFTLYNGDCREVMATFDENSIDAIVTDPPYGIGFMGREWDNFDPDVVNRKADMRGRQKPIPAGGRNGEKPRSRVAAAWEAGRYDLTNRGNRAFQAWCEQWGAEALRVLKPGAAAVVFGSPRTYHRLASGLEDAGFEIRDCLQWLFGSGFPKSLQVVRALDTMIGATCDVDGPNPSDNWQGWGTALKPAYEPIVLARKPLIGTVAENVRAWGTGSLNIDATRIEGAPGDGHWSGDDGSDATSKPGYESGFTTGGHRASGRWPANVCLDESAGAQLDAMSGATGAFAPVKGTEPTADGFSGLVYGSAKGRQEATFYGDTGGASRFFYTAKTSKAEREFGLDDLEPARRHDSESRDAEAPGSNNPRLRVSQGRNDHPTVKPVDLMRWLCRLITPPGGILLDPFLGSGSTGMAALDEGFRFVGIDLEAHYIEIARRRIARRHVIEPLPQRDAGQGVLL